MKKLLYPFVLLVIIGFTSCVKNKAEISFTFNKAEAVYASADELRNAPLISSPRTINNPGKIYIGESILLIGEENEGIHIYDNTNPSAPSNITFINIPYCKEFYFKDGYIYAETHYDLVKINAKDVNNVYIADRLENAFGDFIENDEGEVLVGFTYHQATVSFKTDSPEAEELEESNMLFYDYNDQLIPRSSVPSSFVGNGDEDGTLNRMAIKNDYLYIVTNTDVMAIHNGAEMSLVSREFVSEDLETAYVNGNNLFIGTRWSMIIMDITNSSSPNYISEYVHPNSCDPVLPHGNTAYVTLRSGDLEGCAGAENSLHILDISDLDDPTPLNVIDMNSPYGMSIINQKLYVGEGSNGLSVFDISNPADPQFITNNAQVEAFDVLLHPTITDLILTTGENGIEQYNYDAANNQLTLISSISF